MKPALVVLSVFVLSCGPGVVGEGGDETTVAESLRRAALRLTIGRPLTLSSTTVARGATLTAQVTYQNTGRVAYTFREMSIESRPPGGTHGGGPYETLQPILGWTTVKPGATVTVTASRVFTAADPGTWEAYSTFQRPDGVWVDGPSVFFTYASTTPPVDAGTKPPADAGTKPPVDAGTPPPVDAGTRPPVDAGTPPPVDAGTRPPVDAGTTPPVDAGTPPTPDAGPPGTLVEPVNPGPSDVTFTIRADSDVHAISPLIYGINSATNLATEQRGVGLVRSGGNRWTAYNWENNASNAGTDYLNQSDNYLSSSTVPGAAVRSRVDPALASGAAALVTIPIQGYAAADRLGDGDVGQTTNYLQTRFKKTVAKKNAAFSLTPDTSDGYVYQDEFVNWLKVQYPNAFTAGSPKILLSLDNEPDLWSDTHPRIQPSMVSPATLIAKNIEFATAAKAVIPTAIITGFVSYGYYGFMAFQGEYSGDFTSHYLDEMRAAGVAANKRLIDVLDLHWYPEATGDGQRITGTGTSAGMVTARVQAPRSLWDPTYQETSWVASSEGEPVQLLPKMKARIAAHYPGTKLGFTEYSYGGGAHISGAIAEADVLGVFGREDVYLANFWSLASSEAYIYAGMRVFTSYDEAGAHFGDTSVRATTSNVASTSVYASIDAAHPGRMVLVAINKTGAPVTAALSLAAYGTYTSARVYRLTSASTSIQSAAAISATTRNGFFYQMPAYSISVLVPQ